MTIVRPAGGAAVTSAELSTRLGRRVENAKDAPYSAAGDGVADDTAAIHAALAVGDTYLPDGLYNVTGITVPLGRRLFGEFSHIYTSVPTQGARIRSTSLTQTAPVVTLLRDAALEQVAIAGAGKSSTNQHDGILCSAGRNTIRSVTIANCRNGIDVSYSGVVVITQCQIHDNYAAGVLNPVDSIISHNYINVNIGNGVSLGSGANDNLISDNKIEWNTGRGVFGSTNSSNIISRNNIDRNRAAGLRMTTCTGWTVSDNIFRRNGAGSSAVVDDDAHIYSQSNVNCRFIGNGSSTGVNDDGTGYLSPLTAYRQLNCTDVTLAANHLGGATTSPVVFVAGNTSTRLRMIGNSGYITEASGTATVTSAATTVAVTHGLGFTPGAQNIQVTPTNNLGNAGKFWITSVGATTFTITVDIAPGATTATFAWRAGLST